jgi:hypothetical protein
MVFIFMSQDEVRRLTESLQRADEAAAAASTTTLAERDAFWKEELHSAKQELQASSAKIAVRSIMHLLWDCKLALDPAPPCVSK